MPIFIDYPAITISCFLFFQRTFILFPSFAEALAEAVKENFILFFLLALLSQGSA